MYLIVTCSELNFIFLKGDKWRFVKGKTGKNDSIGRPATIVTSIQPAHDKTETVL